MCTFIRCSFLHSWLLFSLSRRRRKWVMEKRGKRTSTKALFLFVCLTINSVSLLLARLNGYVCLKNSPIFSYLPTSNCETLLCNRKRSTYFFFEYSLKYTRYSKLFTENAQIILLKNLIFFLASFL